MTMNATALPSVAGNGNEEGISAAHSSASCVISVTSSAAGGYGNESGSVGSNSTKTRFSFYNAKEVQMEEQMQNAEIMASSQKEEDNPDEEKSPAVKSDSVTKINGDDEDVEPTSSLQSASNAEQRFNFYISEEAQSAGETKTEDDRRSPSTPLVIDEEENGNNKRTPAVVSASETTNNTPSTMLDHTPQRSNNIFSSAQKKKLKATQAAAARSRTNKPALEDAKTDLNDDKNATEEDVDTANMDSDEILRSLQVTEQMRNNLMKECVPQRKDFDSNNVKKLYEDIDNLSLGSQPHHGAYETASEHLPGDSKYGNDYRNMVQRPASAASSVKETNPYEDAIREALDLLRKHRPPSPDHQFKNEDSNQHELAIDMNVVHGATSSPMMRSPRDTERSRYTTDRVMQSRWESPHDHQQEISARRRERKERMARYTSRLAELKSSEDGQPKRASEARSSGSDSMDSDSQDETYKTNNSLASQPPPPPIPADHQRAISPSFLSGDVASLGTASSPSAANCNTQNSQKEVHRSVERVLLAILERAHSNGRAAQSSNNTVVSTASSQHASVETQDSSWQHGEEKKLSSHEKGNAGGMAVSPTFQQEDPLLRAVGELLSTNGSSSVISGSSPMRQSGSSRQRQSDWTVNSKSSSVTKRSVVEELLAEAESFGGESKLKERSKLSGKSKKSDDDQGRASPGIDAIHSDTDGASVPEDKNLDDLVLKTLGKAKSKATQKSESSTENDEDDTIKGTGDDSGNYEGNSGSCDDDMELSYDSKGDSDDELDDALEGVLGPLSKSAGGITGVVLESNASPASDRSTGEPSIFDSLSNAMSSLVASAISGDEKQQVQNASTPRIPVVRDKYATGLEHYENGEDLESTTSADEDEEASELMRSLCAHLLPFGVDQSNRFLDEVPQWDESNPSEAGYRIIRLTSQQLQRVEHAFESMVHGLKKNSEQNLMERSQAEAENGDVDVSFERDLAVAEKVLDQEEKGRAMSLMKALNLMPKKNSPNHRNSSPDNSDSEIESESGSDSDRDDEDSDDGSSVEDVGFTKANRCHPDFPGVHSAGRGEMGDLEYFHLPVIFKSHVTGFEPTKDLYLEPGNVVAGQYLVETELGSAAFSTAYRCVDLNSEGDDTEDGHQEVCLKVIKNTKDFFDQSLDEIKILELLRQTGQCHENHIIEMRTFFYHREHLIIVTELLRQNLFEFGKFILDHDEEPYFTIPRLAFITHQCLVALRFVHKLGLVHSDVKPENILLGSYSRAQIKLIDFGSSCYLTDRQSSYIQSRSYRAPEVVLGLPYDGKIDVWSLGCVVAEMFTGEVTFQNDSVVSMLSRIEAICGPFPRHMIAQGRQSCRFFTKCGLLFEKVGNDEDGQQTPDVSDEDVSENDPGSPRAVYDIFQPKVTAFSSRLGFAPDIHERFVAGEKLSLEEKQQAVFVDFVSKLLTIDPDSRLSAAEALRHPWMVYAETLTEEDIKYPSP